MKILLVSYGGGHAAMLMPVALRLRQLDLDVHFLALTTAQSFLRRHGVDCFGFRDLPYAEDSRALMLGAQLASMRPPGSGVSYEETVAYLGLNFLEMVETHGEVAAEALFTKKGRQAFLPVALFERFLRDSGFGLVISTNAPRSERAAILAAGRLRIPSVCVVDMFAVHEMEWIGQPGFGSRVCVLNERVREEVLLKGRLPQEVVVTGNPAFEDLTKESSRMAGAAFREVRGWNDGKLTVLWASQVEPELHPFVQRVGDPELPRAIERVLREFVSKRSDFRLVVRYHPSERVQFCAGQKSVEVSDQNDELNSVLHAVDIVVVTTSTVGLQAFIAGKIVVSVDNSVFSDDVPYRAMGISVGVPAPSELPSVLLSLAGCSHKGTLTSSSRDTIEDSTKKVVDVALGCLGEIE